VSWKTLSIAHISRVTSRTTFLLWTYCKLSTWYGFVVQLVVQHAMQQVERMESVLYNPNVTLLYFTLLL